MKPFRVALLSGLIIVAVLLPAHQSGAHTSLLRATPEDGAVLETSPARVELEFSAPVSTIGPGLTVADATGTRVDVGPDGTAEGLTTEVRGSVVSRELPVGLADGEYLVTWRVRSDDGHAVTGSLTFRIVRPDRDREGSADSGASTTAPSTPLSTDGSNLAGTVDGSYSAAVAPVAPVDSAHFEPPAIRVAASADAVARAVLVATILLTAGLLSVGTAIATALAHRRIIETLGHRMAIVGLVATVASMLLQAVVQAGDLVPDLVRDALLSPPVLQPAAVRMVGLGVAVLATRAAGDPTAAAPTRPARGRSSLAALGGVLALLAFAIDGHQRGAGRGVLALANAVHVAGGAAWFAAVATLTIAVRRRAGDVAEMDGLARRVSRVAGLSVAALAVAGGYQALVLVGSPSALLGTTYGRAVTVKVAALALAVLVAAAARARSLRTSPATGGPGDWSFARSRLRVELGLIVAAAATTGLLVTLAPPAGSTPTGITSSASLDDDLEPALVLTDERGDGRTPDTSGRD